MTSRGKSKAAKAKDEEFSDYLKLKARTEKVNYPPHFLLQSQNTILILCNVSLVVVMPSMVMRGG